MSQSTNDAFPTAVRITVLGLVKTLLSELAAGGAFDQAQEFDHGSYGRTTVRRGPIRLGQEFGAYAESIRRDIDRIERATGALTQ